MKWNPDKCDCSVAYTLAVVGGKWKWLIIYKLWNNGIQRYGELKKSIPHITHKMLSQQLKELELEKLISRNEYHQIPPKVEYALTEKGTSLIPILQLMSQWGDDNKPDTDSK
ncbi:MAG: helix-turn-helix transcriptional regulator [Megasphaera sp.]|jgi:DNA-binding HxlR family transcriptional regulator|uniref:winged helix-turn-helix transcriptional regulator n=1 Tax=Megasphaera sueciensis TaxID=349094 RepID=UPI003D0232C0|nr:helix-turn-helix transcriptional regulator [Megasphaera sp.]MCI1823880.1 helix-turn-helix transcriptional regulator [Megasphaera sp.]